MGIERMINRNCRQTAVYWGNPQNDGYSNYSYDPPVEIACRWVGGHEVAESRDGQQFLSSSTVHVTQDVDEKGLLYLGTLDDLDSAQADDPTTIEDICIIRRFDKSPALNNPTEFLRKAYLTLWNVQKI